MWRDVNGWEDRYMISSTGKVYSKLNKLIKKTSYTKDGHEVIVLSRDGKQYGTFVHRLVAQAFIPNPNNLPIINHKDENPKNNNVENLEWCTYSYNNTYNDIHIKNAHKTGNKVYQYSSNGDLIKEFYSCKEASRLIGIPDTKICECCNGKLLTTYGYVFSYKELCKEEVLNRFNPDLRKNNKLSKRVSQYDLEMNYITTYPSAQEASRQLGFSQSLISSVCRGEHSFTHGFIFRYV